MFGLDLLARQASRYVACDLFLHVVPPVVASQVLVHLGAARGESSSCCDANLLGSRPSAPEYLAAQYVLIVERSTNKSGLWSLVNLLDHSGKHGIVALTVIDLSKQLWFPCGHGSKHNSVAERLRLNV